MVRRAHHRAPAELQNDASLVENMKDMYMITKSSKVYIYILSIVYILYLVPIRSLGSTEGTLEAAGRGEQHIITEAVPNELKLGRRKVMRAGHRQGGGVRGCSSSAGCENHLVGSEFSEGTQTNAHTAYSNIRLGSL